MWWKSFTQFTNSRHRVNETCMMISERRSENGFNDSSSSVHLSVCLLAVMASLRTTEGTEPVCVRQYAMDFACETPLLSHHLNPCEQERETGIENEDLWRRMAERGQTPRRVRRHSHPDADMCELDTESGCVSLPVYMFMPAISVHDLFRVKGSINVWLGGVHMQRWATDPQLLKVCPDSCHKEILKTV